MSFLGDVFGGITDFIAPITGFVDDLFGGSVGKAIGGATDYLGQRQTNEQNIELARENNAWSADQARINREFQAGQIGQQLDFQREMSGSSYQRAVGDLKAAGLNPMLALMHGGASTPGGGAAGGSMLSFSTPRVENAVGRGISTAFQGAQVVSELKKQAAETDLIRAQIPKTEQETRTSASSAAKMDADVQKVKAEVDNIKEEWQNIVVARAKMQNERDKIRADTQLALLQSELVQSHARLSVLSESEARAMADSWETWWGSHIRPYLTDAEKIGRGVGGALLGPALGRILKGADKGQTYIERSTRWNGREKLETEIRTKE